MEEEESDEEESRTVKFSWVSRASAPTIASEPVVVGVSNAGSSAADAIVGPFAVAMSWTSAATSALRAAIWSATEEGALAREGGCSGPMLIEGGGRVCGEAMMGSQPHCYQCDAWRSVLI